MSTEPRTNFHDLPAEDRAAAYDKACERSGVSDFFDLPAEDRARAYEEAEDRFNESDHQ